MVPFWVSLALSVSLAAAGGMSLNYMDTGNALKILPGHRLRFWFPTIAFAVFGTSVLWVVSEAPHPLIF